MLAAFFAVSNVFAQSNYREASNNFALYTQTGELKHLQNAQKFIDAGYKTRRDSSNRRMNVLRAMVLSSIAYADSARTIKLNKDAVELTYTTLKRLRPRDRQIYESEIAYIDQNLAAAHIFRANKALEKGEYATAYKEFLQVQQLQAGNEDVQYNLALLAAQSGNVPVAIESYKKVIASDRRTATQFLELSDLYKRSGQDITMLKTLEAGRIAFPESKEILFQLVETYAQNKNYAAIVPIIDEALKYEPENIGLNYLAGYSNEELGHTDKAKGYYEKAIQLDQNNYEANLALGLLYLNEFLRNNNNQEAQYHAQSYLLKANEIKPYAVNALRSLALYYKNTGENIQLDRVNMLLNRLVFE